MSRKERVVNQCTHAKTYFQLVLGDLFTLLGRDDIRFSGGIFIILILLHHFAKRT